MRKEMLREYYVECRKIREYAKRNKMTDSEIDKCYAESLRKLKGKRKFCSIAINCITLSICLLVFLYILLHCHPPTSSLILRNVQSFIYPGFKVIRFLSMPLIAFFPSLTALYDESCLLENPYFQVTNLDCFPCQIVQSVINLTALPSAVLQETGRPFVILDENTNSSIEMQDLRTILHENAAIFREHSPNIASNNPKLRLIDDVMQLRSFDNDLHVAWRINHMDPARILRKLFPRPRFMSEWSGQSIERFIFIDGPQSAAYLMPAFECSYVFIIQGSGERNIILKPTSECAHDCKTISITLPTSHILWYNWWYWKPISLPSENSTNVSITYTSSYC